MSATKLPKFIQSEGFVLATIPFIGSLVAFIFEAGYLNFYDVPWTFIQLDFTRVVWASGYVVLILIPYLMAFSFFVELLNASNPILRIFVVLLIPPLLVSVIFALSPLEIQQWWWIPSLLWALLATRFFLLPFIFKEGGENYLDRIKADLRITSNRKALSSISESIDNKVLPIISLIFVFALITFLIGKNFAKSEVEHWVLADRPNMLLVRSYGDTLFLKKVLLPQGQLTNTLEIVKVSDSKNLDLIKLKLVIGKSELKETGLKKPSSTIF